MVTGMNHTGFVVEDLSRSTEFYRDVVGLAIIGTREREGSAISQVVGFESAHLKIVYLGTGDGHVLELIQYAHPTSQARVADTRNALGAKHLAFNVEDIEQTYRRLVRQGARAVNPPVEVEPGRSACYLQDPDGDWIELIEISK